jgi:hypothetical protein
MRERERRRLCVEVKSPQNWSWGSPEQVAEVEAGTGRLLGRFPR